MVLPISNFCFHSGVTLHELCWLYGGRSALTVVALSLPGWSKGNRRHVTKGLQATWRPWTLPAWALILRSDTSHGGTHKQGQNVCTESCWTNPDSSAYYGGAWVTCIFELKKSELFYSSKKCFPDNQYKAYAGWNRQHLKIIVIKRTYKLWRKLKSI